MRINSDNIGKQAKETLKKIFSAVPFLKLIKIDTDYFNSLDAPNFRVTVKSSGVLNKLAIAVRISGEPRYARQAILQMSHIINHQCSYGIFLAPYITSQTADLCAKSSVGTIDLSGNCLISFDNIYIQSEGKPNKFADKRNLQSIYSPKASRVLRVLLLNSKRSWKTQELADEAGVSLGQVANVKKLLTDREWIIETNSGIRLSKPSDLLLEWSENYSYEKNEIYDYYSLKQPADIENALAFYCENNNINYALTGFSGANRIAPSVRGQRVMAYVTSITSELENALSLKKVTSGANVSLFVPYDEGVYYGSVKDELRVVSPIQLYLDLKKYKGRGEEAAETLWNNAIGKLW